MIGHLHRQGLSTSVWNTQGLPIRVVVRNGTKDDLGLFICCRRCPIWGLGGSVCLFPFPPPKTVRFRYLGARAYDPDPTRAKRLMRVVRVRACTMGDGTNRAVSLKSVYASGMCDKERKDNSRADSERGITSKDPSLYRCPVLDTPLCLVVFRGPKIEEDAITLSSNLVRRWRWSESTVYDALPSLSLHTETIIARPHANVRQPPHGSTTVVRTPRSANTNCQFYPIQYHAYHRARIPFVYSIMAWPSHRILCFQSF